MEFTLNKQKLIEAFVYIATKAQEVDKFHAGKILYLAEFNHLRKYGRPITGDTYIAMEYGPVPSCGYDMLKNVAKGKDRGVLTLIPDKKYDTFRAARDPDLSYLSKTDIEELDEAIKNWANESFGRISDETHKHKAWSNVAENEKISYEDMLDGVDAEIIEEAREFSAYGIL